MRIWKVALAVHVPSFARRIKRNDEAEAKNGAATTDTYSLQESGFELRHDL